LYGYSNEDYFHHLIDDKQLEVNKSNRVLQVFGNHLSLTKGLPQVPQASNNDRRIFKHIFQSLFKLSDPVQELHPAKDLSAANTTPPLRIYGCSRKPSVSVSDLEAMGRWLP